MSRPSKYESKYLYRPDLYYRDLRAYEESQRDPVAEAEERRRFNEAMEEANGKEMPDSGGTY